MKTGYIFEKNGFLLDNTVNCKSRYNDFLPKFMTQS